ncbi:TetR/AcrR family transcriptional regulator [Nonomuraea mesophila]|uniref:TetR/AcrR family transcriptional regulator n=1 Tax=Nonomuraea mesophila TaxID=2530382 RepID=UPI001FE5E464|nr:TetR-like C-terminal domain-containing protein [Nonomuraea mesophila]
MLINRAAQMLAARQPVTLRSLVAGTGVSTMAVYTYFDSMDGLWTAMRQEGFTRLAAQLAAVAPSKDPVRDLAALGAAYLSSALASPDLYRVMFDAGSELEDAAAADHTLHCLVRAVERATDVGRFRDDIDPLEPATQSWTIGHGPAIAGRERPSAPSVAGPWRAAGDRPVHQRGRRPRPVPSVGRTRLAP